VITAPIPRLEERKGYDEELQGTLDSLDDCRDYPLIHFISLTFIIFFIAPLLSPLHANRFRKRFNLAVHSIGLFPVALGRLVLSYLLGFNETLSTTEVVTQSR
jgi:hypothetical protein